MKNIAILSSSMGSTFEYLYKKTQNSSSINTSILISNNANCGAILKAKSLGCTHKVINPDNCLSLKKWDELVIQSLKPFDIQLIVLAGYLKKLGQNLVSTYKVINTHPSLLPKYGGQGMYGKKVHKAVHDNNEEETGATIHFVNENYDEGQIIKQKKVKLYKTDNPWDIENKVKAVEKELLWSCIQGLLATNQESYEN